MITTVLFDLDGVVRHFDPGFLADIEQRHGLEAGVLMRTAFQSDLVTLALTGQITRKEWFASVGEAIRCVEATTEWLGDIGSPDPAVLAEIDALRNRGLTIAMLTNGTTAIDEELHALDLTHRFDAIFNSAIIGYTKPDHRVFGHVCDELRVAPSEVFFVDDSATNVSAAARFGMMSQHFEGVAKLRDDLTDLG